MKTLNAAEMKIQNRGTVLNLIRRGGASRIELAKETGLTRAAVGVIVEEMLSLGLVRESGQTGTAAGRRPTLLGVNASFGHALGVNVSRDRVTVGLSDFSGALLDCAVLPPPAGPEETLLGVFAEIDRMRKGATGRFLGVGVTTPGPLDREKGTLLDVPNLEGWQHFEIVARMEQALGRPVRLDNNSNATAMLESAVNPNLRGKSFMELIVAHGIGSGIVTDDGGRAVSHDCEFGHMSLNVDGPRCDCGNAGCAELYASVPAILGYANAQGGRFGSWAEVMDGYVRGDESCARAVRREVRCLGAVAVNALNCFRLDAIVFAGPICYRFEHLKPLLADAVRAGRFRTGALKFLVSEFEDAEIRSAMHLVLQQNLFEFGGMEG